MRHVFLLLLASCVKFLLDCNSKGPAFISPLAAHSLLDLTVPVYEPLRVGPDTIWLFPFKKRKFGHRRRKPCEEENKDWDDAPASQRMPKTAKD